MISFGRSLFSKSARKAPADLYHSGPVKLHKISHDDLRTNADGRIVLPDPDRIVPSRAKHAENSELAKKQATYNQALERYQQSHMHGSDLQRNAEMAYDNAMKMQTQGAFIADKSSRRYQEITTQFNLASELNHRMNSEIEERLIPHREFGEQLYAAKLDYSNALERKAPDRRGVSRFFKRSKAEDIKPAVAPAAPNGHASARLTRVNAIPRAGSDADGRIISITDLAPSPRIARRSVASDTSAAAVSVSSASTRYQSARSSVESLPEAAVPAAEAPVWAGSLQRAQARLDALREHGANGVVTPAVRQQTIPEPEAHVHRGLQRTLQLQRQRGAELPVIKSPAIRPVMVAADGHAVEHGGNVAAANAKLLADIQTGKRIVVDERHTTDWRAFQNGSKKLVTPLVQQVGTLATKRDGFGNNIYKLVAAETLKSVQV